MKIFIQKKVFDFLNFDYNAEYAKIENFKYMKDCEKLHIEKNIFNRNVQKILNEIYFLIFNANDLESIKSFLPKLKMCGKSHTVSYLKNKYTNFEFDDIEEIIPLNSNVNSKNSQNIDLYNRVSKLEYFDFKSIDKLKLYKNITSPFMQMFKYTEIGQTNNFEDLKLCTAYQLQYPCQNKIKMSPIKFGKSFESI